MRNSIYIFIGIVSALIESAVHISWYGIGIELAIVSLIGLSLYSAGNRTAGTYIILSGAIVLDLFSPYRFGLFLFTSVIVLASMQIIFVRTVETGNSIMTFIMMLGAFIVLHIFEFLSNPLFNVLFASAIINAITATILIAVCRRMPMVHDSSMVVSKNVHLR